MRTKWGLWIQYRWQTCDIVSLWRFTLDDCYWFGWWQLLVCLDCWWPTSSVFYWDALIFSLLCAFIRVNPRRDGRIDLRGAHLEPALFFTFPSSQLTTKSEHLPAYEPQRDWFIQLSRSTWLHVWFQDFIQRMFCCCWPLFLFTNSHQQHQLKLSNLNMSVEILFLLRHILALEQAKETNMFST